MVVSHVGSIATAGPFRKCSVTGISEPNRLGLAASMGIDPTSMHRHHAGRTQPPAPVHHQSLIGPLHMVVAGVLAKRPVRQVYGLIKEGFRSVFVHGGMVRRCWGFLNSHFFSQINLSMGAIVSAPEA